MATQREARRRRYGEELKQQVLSECQAPGASVARVAMAHGINANIVHTWRKRERQLGQLPEAVGIAQEAFVPMMLPPPVASAPTVQLQVQVKRGSVEISVTWPLEAAAQLALWTRELLK